MDGEDIYFHVNVTDETNVGAFLRTNEEEILQRNKLNCFISAVTEFRTCVLIFATWLIPAATQDF